MYVGSKHVFISNCMDRLVFIYQLDKAGIGITIKYDVNKSGGLM